MTKRVIIPIYQVEKDYWQEHLNKNRGIRSVAAYSMILEGIKHWKEDVSFEEYLNVPTYPETSLVYKIALLLDEEDEVYKIIEELRATQKLRRSKIARFFMFYDWRYRQ